MLKKLIASILLLAAIAAIPLLAPHPRSDKNLMSNTVRLVGKGSCSGEQVQAPSGKKYILTAAHCRILADNFGEMMVVTEDGRVLQRRVIAEDKKSDLLLIEEVPGLDGLEIADSVRKTEHVRTFTHGAGLDTYKTEGQLIQEMKIDILLGFISTPEQEKACESAPKTKVAEITVFDITLLKACILSVVEAASTAMTVPGSSGGMVVNDTGELVGVVSAGGDAFSFFVTLKDIKAFLANY